MGASQQVLQTQMITFQQPQQQVVPYNQGYYGQLLEAFQGYQEENDPKIV